MLLIADKPLPVNTLTNALFCNELHCVELQQYTNYKGLPKAKLFNEEPAILECKLKLAFSNDDTFKYFDIPVIFTEGNRIALNLNFMKEFEPFTVYELQLYSIYNRYICRIMLLD